MREIKFRAWDKTNKVMLTNKDLWIHIYPQEDIKETSVANLPDYHIGEQPNDISYDPRTDLEVMQFTGLKDKNGKEIYESDILEDEEGDRFLVRYTSSARFVADLYGEKGFVYDEFALDDGHWMIIGNEYEHPDLLNSKE